MVKQAIVQQCCNAMSLSVCGWALQACIAQVEKMVMKWGSGGLWLDATIPEALQLCIIVLKCI